MSSIGSIASHTATTAWNALKDTVRGATDGDATDIARVVVGAAVMSGSIPVGTGVAVLAGQAAAGRLLDVFA